jgi:RES domain-containing protein
LLRTVQLDQRDTHRLIPARFADRSASILVELTEDPDLLEDIMELDNATNNRLWSEAGAAPGISPKELVFGIPSYRIINAAFCYPAPAGSRFNSPERGAWYAAFELDTSQAEVAYHRQRWLEETKWEEEDVAEYVDYLADFRAEFHDIRRGRKYEDCLSPDTYKASQMLAARLLESGSAGIVYPSVRRFGGTCIVCFRPVLVTNVRQGQTFTFIFSGQSTAPTIRPT